MIDIMEGILAAIFVHPKQATELQETKTKPAARIVREGLITGHIGPLLAAFAIVFSIPYAHADALPEDMTLPATVEDLGGHSWCRKPSPNETEHYLIEFHNDRHDGGTLFYFTFRTGSPKQIRQNRGSWVIGDNHVLRRWGGIGFADFFTRMSPADKTRFYQKDVRNEQQPPNRFWTLWCQCDQAPRPCPEHE